MAVIDCNGIQADGPVGLDMEPVAEKWRAFGWDVGEIDGNDMTAIVGALMVARTRRARTRLRHPCRTLPDRLPADTLILIDVHARFTEIAALQAAERFADLDIYWCEEPTSRDRQETVHAVSLRSPIPVGWRRACAAVPPTKGHSGRAMAAGSNDEAGSGKPIGRLGVRDIARLVGVAPMTVPRVLSNPDMVAPATRARGHTSLTVSQSSDWLTVLVEA